jgi:diguanylate cyclase (GGDEF)-like protein
MSLRKKVLSLLLGAILLFSGVEYAIHNWLTLPGFLRLEERQAEQDLRRVLFAIESEIEHLDSVCWDWAAWDDMYNFVDTPGPEFIASNFVLGSFLDNRINLIYLFDQQGRLVWGEAHELEDGRPLALALFEEPVIPEFLVPPTNASAGQSPGALRITGLLPTEQGPMLLSVRPVMTSDNQGPIRGTLIMGRLLDASMVKDLVERTRLIFSVRQLESLAPFDLEAHFPRFDTSDANRLVVYQPYPDLWQKPAFMVRVETPRTLIQTVCSMRKHVILSQGTAGLVLLVLMSALLQGIVLGPLCRLTAHARSIRMAGTLSARIRLRREDEIGQLSSEFDSMMVEIEQKASELAAANSELQRLSDEDMVTHLANRRKFDACLSQEWKRMFRDQRPLSLVLCDVDFFKLFNDSYGHLQGDMCLRAIAGALQKQIHRTSDLAARFGGEEFAAILVDTDLTGALVVAEAIRQAVLSLEIPHGTSTIGQYVTMSIGVASLVPGSELCPEILVELADQALYRAKGQGRNQVCLQDLAAAPGYQPGLWAD